MDIVVTTAIATMVVKRSWLNTPIDSPIVATMTSVEPRAFMPQPSAIDFGPGHPAETATEKRPAELAQARNHDQTDRQK